MDSKIIGRRITAARLGAGYKTAADFAPAIGKSPFTIRSYEAGRINPPTSVLEKIAEVTRKPIQWLLGSDEEEVAQGTVNVPLDTLRQLIASSECKEKEPSPNGESSDNGILELLNDNELCNQLKVTASERAALAHIRDGYVKRKEQAMAILMAFRS